MIEVKCDWSADCHLFRGLIKVSINGSAVAAILIQSPISRGLKVIGQLIVMQFNPLNLSWKSAIQWNNN